MIEIDSIQPILISSDYGNNKILGQPLGLKTIGIVKVNSKNGLFGYGESYIAIYIPELFETLVNFINNKLKNKSFENPLSIYDSFYIPFCSSNGLLASIYSGIDIALWDLTCKTYGKTLNDYLDISANKDLKFYFSGGSAAFNSKEISEEISKVNPEIFSGYKMRIGKTNWEHDLERIKTSRKGWDRCLMLDAIMGTIRPPFTKKHWENKINSLDEFLITWLEEPIHPENIYDLKNLKVMYPKIDIALGESLTGKLEIRSYLNNKYLDILQLDVTHCGGISMLISMLPEIQKSNKRITMHVWGSPLAFSANLKFASILKNVEWVEYPGVILHAFTKFDTEYYDDSPNFQKYLIQPNFTSIDFLKVRDINPYVIGTGFQMD
tara:strand:+ start:346 stop:1485 length:1140 start_codon:yes stop_codon:yes gene_type:complete